MSKASPLPRRAWTATEAAERYEKWRPGYASDAISFVAQILNVQSGTRIVDVGAGTGKLTRQLLSVGAEIVAVEPLEGMRAVFQRAVPRVTVLDGHAESLPLSDKSFDALVAGQAWHWFDSQQALAEAARVLKTQGGIALLWNDHDPTCEWLTRYDKIRARASAIAGNAPPSHTEEGWHQAFRRASDWADLQHRTFRHEITTNYQGFLDRAFTSSVFSVLPEGARVELGDEILDMLRHANGRERDMVTVPHVTEVYWSLRFGMEPDEFAGQSLTRI